MHLRRFKHDFPRRSPGLLRRLPQERVENVHDVEVTKPIDPEVAIKTICVETVWGCVNPC